MLSSLVWMPQQVKPNQNKSEQINDGGPYHIETSPLICKANQWAGFYMIGTSVIKELINCTR